MYFLLAGDKRPLHRYARGSIALYCASVCALCAARVWSLRSTRSGLKKVQGWRKGAGSKIAVGPPIPIYIASDRIPSQHVGVGLAQARPNHATSTSINLQRELATPTATAMPRRHWDFSDVNTAAALHWIGPLLCIPCMHPLHVNHDNREVLQSEIRMQIFVKLGLRTHESSDGPANRRVVLQLAENGPYSPKARFTIYADSARELVRVRACQREVVFTILRWCLLCLHHCAGSQLVARTLAIFDSCVRLASTKKGALKFA